MARLIAVNILGAVPDGRGRQEKKIGGHHSINHDEHKKTLLSLMRGPCTSRIRWRKKKSP